MKGALGHARSATHDLLGLTDTLGPQMRQLTDYMNEIATQFQGSAAADFYMPQRALTDPRYTAVLDHLISENGRAAYLLVYGDGSSGAPTAPTGRTRFAPPSRRPPRRAP